MTGRERIEAALSPGGVREVPVVIPYESVYVRDRWDELTDCPWWYVEDPDIDHQLRWRRDVIRALGQDWFRLPLMSQGYHRYAFSARDRQALSVSERCDGVYLVDQRDGGETKLSRPPVGGWPLSSSAATQSLPTTPQELDALLPPVQDTDLESALAAGCGDLAAALMEEFGQSHATMCLVPSPIKRLNGPLGFEGMMTLIVERPDLVRHACEHYLNDQVPVLHEAAALGVSVVWLEETLTDMISPRAYAELNLPVLQRLTEEIHRQGMRSVYYYCGNPAGKWDLLLDAGADALALEESKKGFSIDIETTVERSQGRCTLLGNLDSVEVLEGGADQDLREEIRRQIAVGRRNADRFIMSLGSPITPDTSVKRVRLYTDLAHELGRLG